MLYRTETLQDRGDLDIALINQLEEPMKKDDATSLRNNIINIIPRPEWYLL